MEVHASVDAGLGTAAGEDAAAGDADDSAGGGFQEDHASAVTCLAGCAWGELVRSS